jgi:hypothetical protein
MVHITLAHSFIRRQSPCMDCHLGTYLLADSLALVIDRKQEKGSHKAFEILQMDIR